MARLGLRRAGRQGLVGEALLQAARDLAAEEIQRVAAECAAEQALADRVAAARERAAAVLAASGRADVEVLVRHPAMPGEGVRLEVAEAATDEELARLLVEAAESQRRYLASLRSLSEAAEKTPLGQALADRSDPPAGSAGDMALPHT
jgi:hypothetical protein